LETTTLSVRTTTRKEGGGKKKKLSYHLGEKRRPNEHWEEMKEGSSFLKEADGEKKGPYLIAGGGGEGWGGAFIAEERGGGTIFPITEEHLDIFHTFSRKGEGGGGGGFSNSIERGLKKWVIGDVLIEGGKRHNF